MTYVIGEAGSNHNGTLEGAVALVEVAADAGCDAVKFQLFDPEKLYPQLRPPGLRLFEPSWLPTLEQVCAARHITLMCTPFDVEAVRVLDPYVTVWKVASRSLRDYELLAALRATGKPGYISCGSLATEMESDDTVIARALEYVPFTPLHCVSRYPCPIELSHLERIGELRRLFGPSGYSDHTESDILPVAAVALGACAIEKHFTLSRSLLGPDHHFALEPDELTRMVRAIRALAAADPHACVSGG